MAVTGQSRRMLVPGT